MPKSTSEAERQNHLAATQSLISHETVVVTVIGCRLEQLQLETSDRIQRALATYTIVAWRLLWITYLARYHPDPPADTVLATHEWQALYCLVRAGLLI